jgi:hypothetical protein
MRCDNSAARRRFNLVSSCQWGPLIRQDASCFEARSINLSCTPSPSLGCGGSCAPQILVLTATERPVSVLPKPRSIEKIAPAALVPALAQSFGPLATHSPKQQPFCLEQCSYKKTGCPAHRFSAAQSKIAVFMPAHFRTEFQEGSEGMWGGLNPSVF